MLDPLLPKNCILSASARQRKQSTPTLKIFIEDCKKNLAVMLIDVFFMSSEEQRQADPGRSVRTSLNYKVVFFFKVKLTGGALPSSFIVGTYKCFFKNMNLFYCGIFLFKRPGVLRLYAHKEYFRW